MPDKELVIAAWFSVEFQGKIVGAFRECSGFGSENEVVEYKARNEKGQYVIIKTCGNLKWNDITLKRGITDDADFAKWRHLVEQGKMSEARMNGTITMRDSQGNPIAKWNITRGWPRSFKGSDLSADESRVAVEELVITHEGCERVS